MTTKLPKFVLRSALIIFILLSISTFQLNAQNKKDVNNRITSSAFLEELYKQADGKENQQFIITSEHVSKKSGIHHIYICQALDGLKVAGTESSLHFDTNGKRIAGSSNFVNNIQNSIKNKNASLSAEQAIQKVAQQMGYGQIKDLAQISKNNSVDKSAVYTKGGISVSEIPVKLMYYYEESRGTTLVWELSIEEINSSDWWNFMVDASTGNIINKENFTVSCIDGHIHSHDEVTAYKKNTPSIKAPIYTVPTKEQAMVGSYNVIGLPDESPQHGSSGRQVIVNPDNSIASPFGWHDTNGVAGAESEYTIGNNTDAYDDRTSTTTGTGDGVDSERAFGGPSLIFNDPFNPVYSGGSDTNRSIKAAVTNLFYWSNILHDVMYLYGFDEPAGNFQFNNYGNGGIGGDSVRSEAQDGSGTCNANFSTPSDGGRGRMQMYICGSRDGDFDNGVIAHEYGHGISNRLTGGAAAASCLQNSEQMGEGWSDFFGLILTIQPGNTGPQARGIGTWLLGEGPNGDGIRTFPYSTNMAINPHTYDNIKTAAIPHGVGSVWSAMLWEMTWSLIDVYGFDADIYNGNGGNNIALQLVIEGLKLQPCSPGFVDGRNAILAADEVLYGGANVCTIWKAFAKRGLGFSASQGSSGSRTDGIQAFDVPVASLNLTRTAVCITEGTISSLGGGSLVGGIYSGLGVTDDGNGRTFTFDAAAAGVGTHIVTYIENCNSPATQATQILTVTDGLPVLICQDVILTLDGSGNASLTNADVVANLLPGDYVVDQSGSFSPETFTGTSVTLGDDAGSAALPIGFSFNFFGNDYTSFHLASNGFVSFDGSGMSGAASYTPNNIPNTGNPNTMIALVWDDLNPTLGGTIKYTTTGTAPNRRLLVTYENIRLFGSTNSVTVQLKLFEGTNRIEIHTTNAQNDGGLRTQGIESAGGTSGLPTPNRNNNSWTASNDFVAFYRQLAGLADNCGNPVSLSLSKNNFTCKEIGENSVIVTADDGNGGISTCTATVTVVGPTATFASGSWSPSPPTASTKALFNSDYTSAANIDACSCEVSASSTVTIANGSYMKIEGNITVNGSLIIQNSGSVVQVDNDALVTNNGTILVNKTTPTLSPGSFMIVGSPVTAETRTGVFNNSIMLRNHITANFSPNLLVAAADPLAENFADDNGDNWVNYSGAINPGEGYLVRPYPTIGATPVNLTYTLGTLNNGIVNFATIMNANQNSSPNIVSNPYASAIDADIFLTQNTAVNTVYFWEHLSGQSQSYPGYQVSNWDMGDISMYNATGGLPAPNGGTAPTQFISSGQGFGFKALTTSPVVFNNNMRVTGNNNTYRRDETDLERIWLQVYNETYGLGSTTLIGFTEMASNNFEPIYDTKRLASPISLFSTLATSEELAIQAKTAFNINQEVQLGFASQVEENQQYTISIFDLDGILLPEATVYLLDNELNILTNLTEDRYTFTTYAVRNANRFTLLFKAPALGINDSELQKISMVPNPTKGLVLVSSPQNALTNITVFDIQGRKIKEINRIGNNNYTLDLSNLQSAVYFVKIDTASGTITKRIIME